eukprot:scaffold6554_cov142-Isochrysis_galbana.AAC.5
MDACSHLVQRYELDCAAISSEVSSERVPARHEEVGAEVDARKNERAIHEREGSVVPWVAIIEGVGPEREREGEGDVVAIRPIPLDVHIDPKLEFTSEGRAVEHNAVVARGGPTGHTDAQRECCRLALRYPDCDGRRFSRVHGEGGALLDLNAMCIPCQSGVHKLVNDEGGAIRRGEEYGIMELGERF